MKRLLVLLVVGGAVALVMTRRKEITAEWNGLTESEARARLEQRLPSAIRDEKRTAAIDAIVARLSQRGLIVPDTAAEMTIDLTEQPAVPVE